MSTTTHVNEDALRILNDSTAIEQLAPQQWALRLTCGVIARKALYRAVNQVLEMLGGKWNYKRQAHLFDHDPALDLSTILASGILPPSNPTAYYPTPAPLADRMTDMLDLDTASADGTLHVLEPSAGSGGLVAAIRRRLAVLDQADLGTRLHVIEILPGNQRSLLDQGCNLVAADFIGYQPAVRYDWIVMNPPFSTREDANAWMTHLEHAWELLADRGQLVAILPAAILKPNGKRAHDLHMTIIRHGEIALNPADSFKSAGTRVETCLIYMRKTDLSWQHEPTFNYVGGGSWHVWNWALMCENDHPTHRAENHLVNELMAQGLQTTLTEDGRLLPTLKGRLLPVYEKVRQQAIKDGLAIEPNGHEIDAMLATFEEHYQNQRKHRDALNGN